MAKTQIIISFDNGNWLCDYITIDEKQTQKEAIDAYLLQYEQARKSMEIVSKLLPSIIHILVMGEQ